MSDAEPKHPYSILSSPAYLAGQEAMNREAAEYCHAMLTASGARDRLVQGVSVHVTRDGETWTPVDATTLQFDH